MCKEVGIYLDSCFLTYVLLERPAGGDIGAMIALKAKDRRPDYKILRDKHCRPEVADAISRLSREIELVQPNVIIACGDLAAWALTGNWSSAKWRGSTIQTDLPLALSYQPKVVVCRAPYTVLTQWDTRPIYLQDLRRALKASITPDYIPPDYRFVIRPDYPTVIEHLNLLLSIAAKRPLPLAIDIETRGGHIACIGLAWSKREAICIPLMCVERAEGYWSYEEECEIHRLLRELLFSKTCLGIGQNFLYDAQYFYRWLHYSPHLVHDTMIAQHSCFPNMPKGLDFLASLYCEHYVYWKDEGKEWDPKTGEDQLWRYNCTDAVVTFEVNIALQEVIDTTGMRAVADFQQSMFEPVLATMIRGVRVDHAARSAVSRELLEASIQREANITQLLGHPLNIRSFPQMKELFYESLGQQPAISRKTRTVTCDDEALAKIASREPILQPLVKNIRELRSIGVFSSTFLGAALDIDGRIRCSFNIAGTETYRFSSSTNAFGTGLNLQNIPKGGESGDLRLPNVRALFIPDPRHTFFDIDLSSADLRIVVWESDEPEMKAMLREGLDPYTEIAKEFYHDPSISKKDPRRQIFKSFAHGTHYLGTAEGLAQRLGLSVHQSQTTQDWYFQRFPRIKKWQEDLKNQILRRRMIQNIFGYRYYFFGRIEGTVFNEGAAWLPQSTVACLINRAYQYIHTHYNWCEVLLQVHDSLAGQFPTHLGDWAINEIVKAAEITLPYSDPLVIPVGVKTSQRSWGDCE